MRISRNNKYGNFDIDFVMYMHTFTIHYFSTAKLTIDTTPKDTLMFRINASVVVSDCLEERLVESHSLVCKESSSGQLASVKEIETKRKEQKRPAQP